MKNTKHCLFLILAIVSCAIGTLHAQEAAIRTKSPFPLSEARKQEVLKESQNIIHYYSTKFSSSPLDQWPKPARDSFLIAKAKKINVLFAPDYYRDYQTYPTVKQGISPKKDPVSPGELWYKVTFYTDTLKEKMSSRKLFYAQIWNSGEAARFIIPITSYGDFFLPPLWEDGRYQEWKLKGEDYNTFNYITGYRRTKKWSFDELIREKQREYLEKKQEKE